MSVDAYIFAIRTQNCDGLDPTLRSPLLTARNMVKKKKKKKEDRRKKKLHRQELIDGDENDPYLLLHDGDAFDLALLPQLPFSPNPPTILNPMMIKTLQPRRG